jgi:hypothetical protein
VLFCGTPLPLTAMLGCAGGQGFEAVGLQAVPPAGAVAVNSEA